MSLVGSFESAGAAKRAGRRAAAIVIVLLLLGDLGALYRAKARVRPVTVDQAVQSFRQATAPTGDAGADTIATLPAAAVSGAPGALSATGPAAKASLSGAITKQVGPGSGGAALATTPAPGVYIYDTSGGEAVSALNTSHTYPQQTTMTVVATGCGDDVRWDALKERWDLWHTCTPGHAIALESFTTYHSFLGQVNQKGYACSNPTYFRPDTETAGAAFNGRCTADDGSAAALAGKVVGYEKQIVGGASVGTVRIRIDEVLTGSTHGTRWSDSWYRVADGLLVKRISQTDADTKATFGDTHYTERLTLMLASLDPRR